MPELSLEARILDFARNAETGDFADLAMALFERQFTTLPSYRRHCEELGASPETVKSWTEIPSIASESSAAPRPNDPGEGSAAPESIEFENPLVRLSLPELFETTRLSLIVGAVGAVGDVGGVGGVGAAQDSRAREKFLEALVAEASPQSFVSGPSLDAKGLRSWLGGRQRDRKPVALISDPPGFERLVSVLERRAVKFRLPPGSETFCILSFATAAKDPTGSWREPLAPSLGLAPGACRRVLLGPANSTPLLEQAEGSAGRFRLPHWVRSTALETGQLAILDLASVNAPARRIEPASDLVLG